MDALSMIDRYEVRLENVFEGPMDLLVYLIQKNEVDIYDIPIAFITDQYLGYLELMKALSIDVAGDFLLMAATLTQIKSKMLLPASPLDGEEGEDPRMEITRPLMEYLKMKAAAEELSARDLLGESIFSRQPSSAELSAAPQEREIKAGLFELIHAFSRVLERISADHRIDLSEERISIKDRITELIELLEVQGSAAFGDLFPKNAVKPEMIVTFLAILEMAKLGLISISQGAQAGALRIFYI